METGLSRELHTITVEVERLQNVIVLPASEEICTALAGSGISVETLFGHRPLPRLLSV